MREHVDKDILEFRGAIDSNGHIEFTYHEDEYLFAYVENSEGKLEPSLQRGLMDGEIVSWYGEKPVTIDTPIIDGKSFRQLLENDEISDVTLYGNADMYL